MRTSKINIETIAKVLIVTFIVITLVSVSIELFTDLTKLNRAF